jgi:crotonobetainyl-CoA:carnitine CoA-transferase CaiB-like acyl-CoA transferase
MSAPSGPLHDIRVLDVSTFLAGPYAATLLGDLGADVIKVEPPSGDESRNLGPARAGERAPYVAVNRNKRGIVLDLESAAGREAFARLLTTADVLITNVREPALSRVGLSYDRVREHQPDIIWAGVTAFGADGPYAGRPGIDFLAQGYGGLIAVQGNPGAPPMRVTTPVIDVMTSSLVATGVLAALHHRTATGEGQRIDVSLLDALVHAQSTGLASLFVADELLPRTGNRSRYFAPSGIFECADGAYICITCPTEKFFRYFAMVLDPSWLDDERYRTIDSRLQHEDELEEAIIKRCKQFDRDELLERLIAADVLAAPVHDLDEVVRDPQVLHNEMVVETDHPTLGRLAVTGVPVKLGGTPGSVRRAPPMLGQHTAEVLAEIGYSSEEIRALAQAAKPARAGTGGSNG